jgi:hypothetical protein
MFFGRLRDIFWLLWLVRMDTFIVLLSGWGGLAGVVLYNSLRGLTERIVAVLIILRSLIP